MKTISFIISIIIGLIIINELFFEQLIKSKQYFKVIIFYPIKYVKYITKKEVMIK